MYIILSNDDRLYTGITTDVKRRWKEHSGELKNGAKFFRGRKPKKLLHIESFIDRSSASKREYLIKSISRVEKLLVIKSDINQIEQFESNTNEY